MANSSTRGTGTVWRLGAAIALAVAFTLFATDVMAQGQGGGNRPVSQDSFFDVFTRIEVGDDTIEDRLERIERTLDAIEVKLDLLMPPPTGDTCTASQSCSSTETCKKPSGVVGFCQLESGQCICKTPGD